LQFNKDELIVYTVLIGSNEGLNNQPFIKHSKYRHVCLTDNKNLKSKEWEIIIVDPIFPKDSNRSQRYYKLKPQNIFQNYNFSLYLDNNILLKVKTEDLVEGILKNIKIEGNEPLFFIPYHSYRENLISEFEVCSRYDLDNQFKLYEQLDHYIRTNKEILKERAYWGGIILRNHNNKRIMSHSEIWFYHLCRYSRRDQLSLLYSSYQAGIKVNGFNLDNKKSQYHNWPVELKKRNRKYEEYRLDLLPSRFSEKTEKLITKLGIKKKYDNKLYFFSNAIKFFIRKVRSSVKNILIILIKLL